MLSSVMEGSVVRKYLAMIPEPMHGGVCDGKNRSDYIYLYGSSITGRSAMGYVFIRFGTKFVF